MDFWKKKVENCYCLFKKLRPKNLQTTKWWLQRFIKISGFFPAVPLLIIPENQAGYLWLNPTKAQGSKPEPNDWEQPGDLGDNIWCYMTWYDTIRHDTIRYMIWYDMIWYDMIWYDICYMWYVVCDMWYNDTSYHMISQYIYFEMWHDIWPLHISSKQIPRFVSFRLPNAMVASNSFKHPSHFP